ncbi:MAG: hypothetical protein WDN06_12000 [Asticcacaulis sp.]
MYGKALRGGAQALGVAAGLVEGAAADIVSLKAGHAALFDKAGDARLNAHIFAASGSVDGVWRFGKKVVSDGRHVGRDAILAAYRQAMDRLRA